jgi:hypothetical protein
MPAWPGNSTTSALPAGAPASAAVPITRSKETSEKLGPEGQLRRLVESLPCEIRSHLKWKRRS